MHNSGVLCGEVLSPRTIGDPIPTDMIQTIAIVHPTRLLLLCLAYFIGLVTAMNLINTNRIGRGKGSKIRPGEEHSERQRKREKKIVT